MGKDVLDRDSCGVQLYVICKVIKYDEYFASIANANVFIMDCDNEINYVK